MISGTAFMNAEKTRAMARGFSLLELIVVVAIIAILAMLAVPNLMSIVPQAQLRGSARGAANLMQQARIMADNTQKPARLVIDCRTPAGNPVCRLQLHTAVFNPDGTLDRWLEVPATQRELGRTVRVVAAADNPVPAAVSGNPGSLFWAVFMPTGQMRASHDPMRLVFTSTNPRVIPWELAINRASGRPTLRGLQ